MGSRTSESPEFYEEEKCRVTKEVWIARITVVLMVVSLLVFLSVFISGIVIESINTKRIYSVDVHPVSFVMGDGVALSGASFCPRALNSYQTFPVLLNVASNDALGNNFAATRTFSRSIASHGVIVVIVNSRGIGTSGGVPRDSNSTIGDLDIKECIVGALKLPHANQNGTALLGIGRDTVSVLRVAASRPKGLSALVLIDPPHSAYSYWFPYDAPILTRIALQDDLSSRVNPFTYDPYNAGGKNHMDPFLHFPYSDHSLFWESQNFNATNINVPAYIIYSVKSPYSSSLERLYADLSGSPKVKVVVGPWDEGTWPEDDIGPWSFNSRLDVSLFLRQFISQVEFGFMRQGDLTVFRNGLDIKQKYSSEVIPITTMSSNVYHLTSENTLILGDVQMDESITVKMTPLMFFTQMSVLSPGFGEEVPMDTLSVFNSDEFSSPYHVVGSVKLLCTIRSPIIQNLYLVALLEDVNIRRGNNADNIENASSIVIAKNAGIIANTTMELNLGYVSWVFGKHSKMRITVALVSRNTLASQGSFTFESMKLIVPNSPLHGNVLDNPPQSSKYYAEPSRLDSQNYKYCLVVEPPSDRFGQSLLSTAYSVNDGSGYFNFVSGRVDQNSSVIYVVATLVAEDLSSSNIGVGTLLKEVEDKFNAKRFVQAPGCSNEFGMGDPHTLTAKNLYYMSSLISYGPDGVSYAVVSERAMQPQNQQS